MLFEQTTAKVSHKQSRAISMNVTLESFLMTLGRYFLLGTCHPANIFGSEVNKRNTRKRFVICSKLTITIPERC